jgi:FeS assembly SUF system regulator
LAFHKEEQAMFRLSKLADYGTVLLSYMARQPDRTYSATELAAEIGIGVPTASKILKLLTRHELVQSVRGIHGGYLLARPAEAISLGEVIEALDGPINVTECGAGAGLCARESECGVKGNWRRLGKMIQQTLSDVSVAEFARPDFRPTPAVNQPAARSRRS